ncbi:hypothetical protein [Bradyrhizobium sp. AZCC 1678]|uniref:hypothetical protein n=1 Tax=Bradyrhizobium sp. AZCC 1678 TaxID=3117030 RepID=UPI003FA5B3AA
MCNKMDETRAFYRDIMKFPIETDRGNWVSFRVGAALLTLRPRVSWVVCDVGKSMPESAAIQLAFRVPPPAVETCMRNWSPRVCQSYGGQPICLTGATARCSFATPRTTSSKSTLNTDLRCWMT